jgi:CRP-like cAMP-binding protein
VRGFLKKRPYMKKIPPTDKDLAEFSRLSRKIKLFTLMKMDLLEKIMAWVMIYEYEKGEKICAQGAKGDCCYIVYEGALTVKVKKGLFSLSKEIATLEPGDILGEMSLISRNPRTATVVCKEPTKLFIILADHFDSAIAANPTFAQEVKKLVAERTFELKNK